MLESSNNLILVVPTKFWFGFKQHCLYNLQSYTTSYRFNDYDDNLGVDSSGGVNSQILTLSMGTTQIPHGVRQRGVVKKGYIPVVRAIPAVKARLPVPIRVHLKYTRPPGWPAESLTPQCVFWDTVTHR